MLICCTTITALAQNQNLTAKDSINAVKILKPSQVAKTIWWKGHTYIQVDAASIVRSTLMGNETYSAEAGLQLDLSHKYFPVLEIGYAGANKTSLENVQFKTNGMFGRVGIDFNLSKQKKESKPTSNLIFMGLRLGITNASYDINNVIITDNYWGGTTQIPYSNIKGLQAWYEITFGLKVEVAKNIFMGWAVRNKHLITQSKEGEISPWYIPGYGKKASSNWAISYTIGYKF